MSKARQLLETEIKKLRYKIEQKRREANYLEEKVNKMQEELLELIG